jgi:hypothetical protein
VSTIRLDRPASHRDDNDAVVAAYGRMLRKLLLSIADAPAPGAAVASAIQNMQDTAHGLFDAAFLRGKKQAVGHATGLTVTDRLWIDKKLASNRHYLTQSLQPDIIAKIIRQRLDLPAHRADRIAAIDGSFGARVQNMYGGVLWTVQEAGFRAGAHHMNEVLQNRSALIQDDWSEPDTTDISQPAQQKEKERDVLLLWISGQSGIAVAELSVLHLRMGTRYQTQHDAKVCGSCSQAAGDYWFPEESPLPGEVCEGGGNCRCWIELIVGTT